MNRWLGAATETEPAETSPPQRANRHFKPFPRDPHDGLVSSVVATTGLYVHGPDWTSRSCTYTGGGNQARPRDRRNNRRAIERDRRAILGVLDDPPDGGLVELCGVLVRNSAPASRTAPPQQAGDSDPSKALLLGHEGSRAFTFAQPLPASDVRRLRRAFLLGGGPHPREAWVPCAWDSCSRGPGRHLRIRNVRTRPLEVTDEQNPPLSEFRPWWWLCDGFVKAPTATYAWTVGAGVPEDRSSTGARRR